MKNIFYLLNTMDNAISQLHCKDRDFFCVRKQRSDFSYFYNIVLDIKRSFYTYKQYKQKNKPPEQCIHPDGCSLQTPLNKIKMIISLRI